MSVQPIERNTVEFFLYFEKEDLTVKIDKPAGIEKADFEIKQNTDGFGRFLTFAESLELNFPPRIFEHGFQFNKLCDYYRNYKWQCAIFLVMHVDGAEFYRGRFKMETVRTDYQYHFKAQIDVNNIREIVEAKKSESIDLVSAKSIDDKTITPITLVDLLTKFKKFYIDNNVEMKEMVYPYYLDVSGDYGSVNQNIYINMFNKAINVGNEVQVVEDEKIQQLGHHNGTLTRFHCANDNTQVRLILKDLDFSWNFSNVLNFMRLWVNVRDSDNVEKFSEDLFVSSGTSGSFQLNEQHWDLVLDKDDILTVFFYVPINGQSDFSGGFTFLKKPIANFFTVSIFEDTVTKANRLIDIGKQTIKSITNDVAAIVAPRFTEAGGNFYDIYATSGLFLRQYNDQPYYATWQGFVEYIRESFNCDFQINGNEIFIGHQSDFYQDQESFRMKFTCNDGSLDISPNENIVKSNFSLGYSKYEDDKASSNTIDSIHVSSEWYLANSQPLDNARIENSIGYVADAYMIENIRRESFNKDSTKTVPNDKEIYIIDTITNAGVLMNRTDEGFEIENLYSPDTAYNVRLSVKRILLDYFSQTLSDIAQFTQDTISWKNTSYLNNREATTTADASVITSQFEIIEGSDITPEQLPNPLLDGSIYEFDYADRVKFSTFLALANAVLQDKGYVTFFDEISGNEVNLFISGLKYSWENEKLYNIKGEKKI